MSPHSIGANKVLPTKLDRIERRARESGSNTFNNLGHVLDLELLRESYGRLDGSKAVGIDGMTKEKYGENLEERLQALLRKIRQGSYRPRASRIVEIPKADGSKRPLAIACLEDKIVQEAAREIVERIFEPRFKDCSYGFRPNRNAHMALAALENHLRDGRNCRALLDIDLRQYFDSIPHRQLIQILETKVKDERFLRLIVKLLKAPTLAASGQEIANEIGSPQGSILSPLMGNIYLHYVLDQWFEKANVAHFGSQARMVRYADDVVFTFASSAQAQAAKVLITERLAVGGLMVNETKTHIIGYHGSLGAYLKSPKFLDDLSKVDPKAAAKQLPKLKQLAKKEAEFFADAGVSQNLFIRTQIENDGGLYDVYFPGPQAFLRYGIRNLVGVQDLGLMRSMRDRNGIKIFYEDSSGSTEGTPESSGYR